MRLTVIAVALLLASVAVAGDRAVIIQGWLPEEGGGQDWGDGYFGRKDELWNDCYLAYELFCSRPGIDSAHDSITMLWAQGQDFPRQGPRYNPNLLLWTASPTIRRASLL